MHGRKSLPCICLHYARRLNSGVSALYHQFPLLEISERIISMKLSPAFAALLLFSLVADAQECDWRVSRKIDPMTDKEQCLIISSGAGIALSVDRDRITFLTGSAYSRHGEDDGLRVRIDDNAAIDISARGRSTGSFEEGARNALREILNGKRIRTFYLDYPSSKSGDALICTLPKLLTDCNAPLERLKDNRSQAEIISDMVRQRGR